MLNTNHTTHSTRGERWVDTHCHLDADEFAHDADTERQRARALGVQHCILPAVHPAYFERVRTLAHRWGDSYALGIHPLYVQHTADSAQPPTHALQALEHALQEHHSDPHLVAVGEIGLDFFVPGLDHELQRYFLREQLRLARRFKLPVVLHVRRSVDAVLGALRSAGAGTHGSTLTGIAHAFNGSEQQAQAFMRLGFKLGFGGASTFERALQLQRLIQQLPLDALVLETDAPDIPPRWLYRNAQERAQGQSQGRNSPSELPRIAQHIAALRNMTTDELSRVTCDNLRQALPKVQF